MMKMLTNCPNCGAPLNDNGYCSYCNTKVRYANEIESLVRMSQRKGITDLQPTEILFKFYDPESETVFLLPIVGKVDNISINYNETCVYGSNYKIASIHSSPEVSLKIIGAVGEVIK